MNHVAKVFTDQEIERMADYFAAQADRPWKEENVLEGAQ
jgi:cytochrome c553